MANYDSISDIFLNISNAEIIRNNTKNDDGVDTIVGVDWVADTICVSGNSFFGTSSSEENIIRVNRRDGACYYVYREEGTLFNHYNFLRIRFSGFTAYNYTAETYKITYDVIFWEENGSLVGTSLHMVDVPSSSYDGNFTYGSSAVSYNKPTDGSPDVTFLTDGTITYDVIDLQIPYYLIRSQGVLYTIADDVLSVLTETNIASTLFQTYGLNTLPTWTEISSLVNPEILMWYDSENTLPKLSVQMTATPYKQTILSNEIELVHSSILGIESATATCTGTLSMAISTDEKATWKAHNGTEWLTLSDDYSGMSKEQLEAITVDQWAEIITEDVDTIYIRIALTDTTQSVEEIVVNFAN